MIEIKNVTFTYNESEEESLKDISLSIKKGECIVLCGESGCGKTSVIRLINGLIPFYYPGNITGEVLIDGEDILKSDIYNVSEKVSSVFQNPRSQFFCVDVQSELAFAAENRKIDPSLIKQRIEEVGTSLDIKKLYNRTMFALSGGEKQKIACASVNITDNNIVVLDEPSSNLDQIAIDELKEMLGLWKKMGKTIVIAEHRLSYLKDIVDKVIYLKEGKIENTFSQSDFTSLSPISISNMGLRNLNPIFSTFGKKEWGSDKIVINDFLYKYPKSKRIALDIKNEEVPLGSVVAIVGKNGAGKSTFVRCLCGLEKKVKGKVFINNEKVSKARRIKKSYIIMQDVNRQLFTESVLDEIVLSQKKEDITTAENILQSFDLLQFKDRHPVSLSGGQKQRVAVASSIASNKEFIFFDEPTSGLDLKHMKQVAQCILDLQEKGKTLFLITHDLELITLCCNYVIHIEEGRIKDSYKLTSENETKLKNTFLM